MDDEYKMYVCLCADVTEDEVIAAIRDGHTTEDQLRDAINVSTGCATCLGYVRKLLKQELTS